MWRREFFVSRKHKAPKSQKLKKSGCENSGRQVQRSTEIVVELGYASTYLPLPELKLPATFVIQLSHVPEDNREYLTGIQDT